MLYKTLEFKNAVGQKLKVTEIPVLTIDHRYYFTIQGRLQIFVSSLYNKPQVKTCFSFRDYLQRKMKGSDFLDLFSDPELKSNA
ncbi:DUF2535 family protein [Bacillus sp. B15-48]|uniref:DUF2535 family protein n=1 Tax=Bacillus sp. B15-48 TaxID=1548601 RepID=UPI00193F0A0A|nr:DUF2535 family protein [Bacillus sp. B15-48]MBM4761670.1 DUF2535 family protein [Bacillus sp. B15-48]